MPYPYLHRCKPPCLAIRVLTYSWLQREDFALAAL